MFSRVADPNNRIRVGRKSLAHPLPSDAKKESARYGDAGQTLQSTTEEKAAIQNAHAFERGPGAKQAASGQRRHYSGKD